jgi:arylformamidase
MPVYPGDPEVVITKTHFLKEHSYEVSQISMRSHNSTHIDAQSHMIEGGKTLSEYSAERVIGVAKICTQIEHIS